MKHLKFFVLILVSLFISFSAMAAEGEAFTGNVAERFSEFDPESKVRINHQPLTEYLQATVLPVGRSWRILGNEKPDSFAGSRIKTGKSLDPSRFEGNRLFISGFSDPHREFFLAYQEGLERLSNRRPLRELNKEEQLAFWLNLYNVIVINKLVEEYPISNLKSLRSTGRGKTSFWDEKVTAVEGVPLSLRDIEEILFANFPDPEVAFGLWQGSIGGPRLQNFAYTGNNVRRALEINAVEFVNSNRGLRPPSGTRMSVSDFYEWVLPAFGTSEDHVLMFIKEYADENFVQGVDRVTEIRFKEYNWTIADLMGGTKHRGQHSQPGGLLTAGGLGGGGNFTGQETFFTSPGIGITGNSSFAGKVETFGGHETQRVAMDIINQYNRVLEKTPTGAIEGLPDHAFELLLGIKTNSRNPVTIITSEECAPGEVCEVENIDDPGA